MAIITLKCDVTEHHIKPPADNDEVVFTIGSEALILDLQDGLNKSLYETEIDKKDAIELAKLILLKYT